MSRVQGPGRALRRGVSPQEKRRKSDARSQKQRFRIGFFFKNRFDKPSGSLDGDGLGEVSRLVDIAAALQRDVVGEDLQRHDAERGREDRVRVGDREDVGDGL